MLYSLLRNSVVSTAERSNSKRTFKIRRVRGYVERPHVGEHQAQLFPVETMVNEEYTDSNSR